MMKLHELETVNGLVCKSCNPEKGTITFLNREQVIEVYAPYYQTELDAAIQNFGNEFVTEVMSKYDSAVIWHYLYQDCMSDEEFAALMASRRHYAQA